MKKTYSFLITILVSLSLFSQDYTQVYMLGGATPFEWENMRAQEMTKVNSGDPESAVFTWEGPLKASDFKFINALGTWTPAFTAVTENQPVRLGEEHRILYDDGNDYKFTISDAGFYNVTIDLKKLTMLVTRTEPTLPEELWIKGSALPSGVAKLSNAYGIANFLYVGELQQGDFKIITTETIGDFTRYIVPLEEDVDITGETRLILTDDAEIPGWNVTVSDPTYKIKINLIAEKSNAEIFKSRENLYMVGGVSEAGWNAGIAIPFTKNEQNPDIFVFDGELKIRPENQESNLFKILGQLDWNPYSLHPYNSDEPILEAQHFQISTGDNKWSIGADKQGRYIIKINTLYETIEAQYVENGSAVKQFENDDYFKIISVKNGVLVKILNNHSANSVQLISMDGRLVNSIRNAGKEFTLGSNVTPGMYLLKIDCDKKHFVQRVILK